MIYDTKRHTDVVLSTTLNWRLYCYTPPFQKFSTNPVSVSNYRKSTLIQLRCSDLIKSFLLSNNIPLQCGHKIGERYGRKGRQRGGTILRCTLWVVFDWSTRRGRTWKVGDLITRFIWWKEMFNGSETIKQYRFLLSDSLIEFMESQVHCPFRNHLFRSSYFVTQKTGCFIGV